ncbi:MAG: MlaD family protein, partial [Fibrobacterota bacterium]
MTPYPTRLASLLAILILSGCSGHDVYRFRFSEVGTLAVGDAVVLSGVKAGKVSEMGLAGSSAIVSVQTDNVMQLRKDAVVRIVGVGLMGEQRIELEQGKSGQFYAPGDTIQG